MSQTCLPTWRRAFGVDRCRTLAVVLGHAPESFLSGLPDALAGLRDDASCRVVLLLDRMAYQRTPCRGFGLWFQPRLWQCRSDVPEDAVSAWRVVWSFVWHVVPLLWFGFVCGHPLFFPVTSEAIPAAHPSRRGCGGGGSLDPSAYC